MPELSVAALTEIVKNPAGAKPQSWENVPVGSLKNKVRRWAVSNPHPHGQIWAIASCLTKEREDRLRKEYFAEQKSPRQDYVQRELADGSRTCRNRTLVSRCAYWAARRSKRYCCPKPTFCGSPI
ncbi:hypothetical protein [Escherichia coli]|uniref:hypothetical protein n=1 Tax=Escherichia coli TaxID=562 RepID=UPI00388D397B